ncbi:hypothetical protein BASA50_005738 [Batrachochytrium salamandrivorans]|uniref:FYVE-type domain-containing protein n=1 Tax=Batrachochytrium salamandrivorans TaxID=1357716 RepID=A0ABQ8FBW5_9FUNG|nr:hypothetical protein BASA62_004457 [Batrachochytrium salamandrivorans]KAH6573246.1 hypothetical protein BASA60_006132 [Batrachochytrium salamandrivorans]KAH6595529.1 hypothetical protein BASA50_005738 [Batrachochytrium salamandrivorans]
MMGIDTTTTTTTTSNTAAAAAASTPRHIRRRKLKKTASPIVETAPLAAAAATATTAAGHSIHCTHKEKIMTQSSSSNTDVEGIEGIDDMRTALEATNKRNRVLESLVSALRTKLVNESDAAAKSIHATAKTLVHTTTTVDASTKAAASVVISASTDTICNGHNEYPDSSGSAGSYGQDKAAAATATDSSSALSMSATTGLMSATAGLLSASTSTLVCDALPDTEDTQQKDPALSDSGSHIDSMVCKTASQQHAHDSEVMLLCAERDALRVRLDAADELVASQVSKIKQLSDARDRLSHPTTKDPSYQSYSAPRAPADMYMSVLTRSKALEKLLETATQQCAALQSELERKDSQLRDNATALAEREAHIRTQAVDLQHYQCLLADSERMLQQQRDHTVQAQSTLDHAISIGKVKDAALASRESVIKSLEARILDGFTHSLRLAYTRMVVTGSDIHRLNRDHWVADQKVLVCHNEACTTQFGLFNRRHHCRRCGNVYCSGHISNRIKLSIATLSYHPDGIETKVCDECATNALEQAALEAADFETLLARKAILPADC